MRTKKATIMKIVGYIASTVLSKLYGGWVFAQLWAWFVVRTFGLPPITIPVAIGLSIIATKLTYQFGPGMFDDEKDEDKRRLGVLIIPLVANTLWLIFGYVVAWFVS